MSSAVATFNKSMREFDLLDGLLSYYCIPVCFKKWYHHLIWHFSNVSVIQVWLLHRKDSDAVDNEKVTSLKEFKLPTVQSLLKQGKREASQRGCPATSVEAAYSAKKKKGTAAAISKKSVRKDWSDHWPEFDENKGRCRYLACTGFPKVKCSKCYTPRSNCLRKFHDS